MMPGSFDHLPKLPNGKIDFAKLYKPEEEIDIDQYFSKKELEEMCDLDRKRYKNLKMNYEVMLMMGLPAVKPDFMKGSAYRARVKAEKERADYKIPSDSSDDSDEEWTPSMNRKKARGNTSSGIRLLDKKMNKASRASKTILNKASEESKTVKSSRPKRTKGQSGEKTEQTVPYNLRERETTNYMDIEVPDDDTYLYCEECNKEYDRDCPIHGEMIWIKDSETQDPDPEKALHSLPQNLIVKESGIPGAGLGVWSEEEFPARLVFGPYGGEIVCNEEKAHSSGYAWQIYKDRKPIHFVDAKDKAKSNWMRYVNCAASESEQNLVAFQYRGQIYYRSYKTIPAGTELLVWYGQEYARDLGMIRDKNLLLVPKYINGEEVYMCLFCKTHSYGSATYYIKHLLKRHRCDKLDKQCIQLLDRWLRKNEAAQGQEMKRNYSDEHHKTHKKSLSQVIYCNKPKSESGPTQEHLTNHSTEQPYEYETCRKEFSQNGIFQRHLLSHTGIKPDAFETCGNGFPQNDYLPTHQRIHTGEKPIKCEACGKAFTAYSNLHVHQRIHTGEKLFKCETCGKAFTAYNNLQKHQRIHTGEKPFKCETCEKAFTQYISLQKHQRIHTGEKPFKCETCEKAFTQYTHLQTHQRIHTGEKPFKCETCGKAFTQNNSLQAHLRIHIGEKPFKCETCGKAFTVYYSLQQHQKIHTGEKPFKCVTCEKAFTQYTHLQRHQRSHTGEKPFKCVTCGKAFTQTGDLQRHQRIHTEEKPFK